MMLYHFWKVVVCCILVVLWHTERFWLLTNTCMLTINACNRVKTCLCIRTFPYPFLMYFCTH